MTDPLSTLADRMVSSRTIGFVGAGASVRLGLPLWSDLIEALYDAAREFDDTLPKPESSLDNRWLAEVYGQVISTRTSLQSTMSAIFREHRRSHPPIVEETERFHDLIARLPFKHFITTNYDRLIEDACDRLFEATQQRRPIADERCLTRDGWVGQSFSEFLGAFSQDTQRSVLHLHGTLQGEQLTLAMAEYNEQYLQDAMLLRMFSILATSTVVFMGASLHDADLMELVRRTTYHTGGRQRHYAFLTDDRRYEADMLRHNFGIQPIFYSPGPDGRHEELDRNLERLLELVESRRRGAALPAGGNARPVDVRHDEAFDRVVNEVKDEVRRVRSGAARVSGLPEVAMSQVLRRVAADYRLVPISYRFHHVVWISPGRIGLFPGGSRSRGVLDSIIGEVVYALGRHRVTGTSDPMVAIRSIREVVGGRRWLDAEPILFVIDGFADLTEDAPVEVREIFDELFSFLPTESVALYCRPESANGAAHASPPDAPVPGGPVWHEYRRDEASRVDPIPAESLPWDAAGEAPCWARPLADDALAELLEPGDDPHSANTPVTVLAALCVVATPIAARELALMLDLTLRDLDAAIDRLGRLRLVEGSTGRASGGSGSGTVADSSARAGQSGSLGVLNPVRRAVLGEAGFRDELVEVTCALLRWAEATVEGFSNWEEDNAQLDQLIRHLPNVLTIFEACCWLTSIDPAGVDLDAVDRHLWLGTDLAYILYNVGRWVEAEHMLEYLRHRADGRIPGTDLVARLPSEPHTFLREVLILQSRYYEHAGTSDDDLVRALENSELAIRNAQQRIDAGDEEYEPIDNTYAPNRLTLARQRARARVARGRALLKSRRIDDAEDELHSVLFHRAFDGPAGGGGEPEERRLQRARQPESLAILADASRALGAGRHETLQSGSYDRDDLEPLFRELDIGRQVISQLQNRRAQGRSALTRGDILLELGNGIAARRYYARALLVAIEFRDRFLEAGAILGLAHCDCDPRLAERARDIYRDLGLNERAAFAGDQIFRLRHEAEAGSSATKPLMLAVVGIPGTGKSIVTRTAGSVLAEWGYQPYLWRDELLDDLRAGVAVDPTQVLSRLAAPLEQNKAEQVPVVGIFKVPTARLGDVFRPWVEDEGVLGRLLCVRLYATEDLLRSRNAQRRSGQLPDAMLEEMIQDSRAQDPGAALGYSSWESAFQASGGALVSVDTAGSILALERRIRNVLALSYLPYRRLRKLEEAEGSSG